MERNWLPRAGACLHFLFPPSILHNGRILLVLRVVNKSLSVTMIIIRMISLKEFYQLNCLNTTILLHSLQVTFVFPGDQYICYLGISLVLPQFPASFSPVDSPVFATVFLALKKGYESGYTCIYSWFTLLYSRNQHNIVKQFFSN